MVPVRVGIYGFVLAAGLTVGCSHKTPTDQTIVTDIQAKLYADSVTKPASIAVTAQDGVVTLSGNVDSQDANQEAMKIARSTTGVRSVNDALTVNGAPANAQAPATSTSTLPPPPAQTASNTPPSGPPAGVAPSTPQPAASIAPAQPAPVRPPQPEYITIPAGERLQVRTIDSISTSTDAPGQTFRASLDAPLVHNERVVIPAGAPVALVVVTARSAGRIKGQSELEVRASAVHYHGRSVPVNTSVYSEEGKARGKQTAVRTGVGAAAGAVIGALAGGGKGAAIGSAVGGGAGFGVNLATHGQQVKIPSETVLTFRLEAPLRLQR